jgi:hypothetical protein
MSCIQTVLWKMLEIRGEATIVYETLGLDILDLSWRLDGYCC